MDYFTDTNRGEAIRKCLEVLTLSSPNMNENEQGALLYHLLELVLRVRFDPEKAKRIRLKKGLKQRELGEITNTARNSISSYETGSQIPTRGSQYLKWLEREGGYDPLENIVTKIK